MPERANQQAVVDAAGNNGGTGITTFKDTCARIQQQTAFDVF